jgi:FlaA1/EpsC-like NDP-sugar epimerase
MISNFYEGKTILITGSTGPVGKVVLEKVLRSFSRVKTVYISIIGSKGDEYNHYKRLIKDSQIFDSLKI